jgi:sulfonate transport system substrate-binding protein
MIKRRLVIAGAAGTAMASVLGHRFASAKQPLDTVRVGFQKSSSLFIVARQQQAFEKHLEPLGVREVRWVEFQFGPPLLEALAAGAVDIGITGDTPPIFAQSAGNRLVYAASSPSVQNALLVRRGSEIRSVKDLKGKKVAFGKGSSSHNFVVQALRKHGLRYEDIEPAFLGPADAVAAFVSGNVDAWSVWDPYFALAEAKHDAVPLATSADRLDSNSFYLAGRDFAEMHPQALSSVVEALAGVARWASDHKAEFARISAEATGIDREAQQKAIDRYRIEVRPIEEPVITQQQAIADTLAELKLIPKSVNVRDIVWQAPTN